MKRKLFARMISMAGVGVVSVLPALADEGTAPVEEDTHGLLQGSFKDTAVGKWMDEQRITLSGHVEAGITGNFDDPKDRQNFGRLFDDRANEPLLNQAVLTIERPLAPEEGKFDWGYKFQFMYGSDARFIHTFGWMDSVNNDLVQPDIVELFASLHFPILTKGGVDVKAGQFVTLMGAEVIYAPANPLYSHSYIFNFGIPFKHTGVLLTTHVTDQFDVCVGFVTGINTGTDDNNGGKSFHGSLNWKSKDEKVLWMGSVHFGDENDSNYNAGDPRIIGSSQLTLKPLDKLTLISDLNYGVDEGFDAEWYGAAQYGIYQINDWLSFVVRGEVFRDDDGFAVVKVTDNDDLIDAQRGQHISPKTTNAGAATYTELTVGLNLTPYKTLLIRPEARWDWANKQAYNDFGDQQQFTLGMDVIFKF